MKKKLFLLGVILFLLPVMVFAEEDNMMNIDSVKCPVIGQKPTYVGGNTEYTTRFEERWINQTDHREMGANETFVAGKEYIYQYGYVLKEGNEEKYFSFPYVDTDACTYSAGGAGAYVNSIDFEVNQRSFYMGNWDDYQFTPNYFTLNISVPTLGGKQPLATATDQYTINSQKWYNVTDDREMTSNETFQQNKKYKYIINYSSFYYAEDLFKNFNNNQYYLGSNYLQGNHIGEEVATAYFYFGNKNDLKINGSVVIGNMAIAAGQKIQQPTITSNLPALYSHIGWSVEKRIDSNTTTYQTITDPNAVFEVGKTYNLEVMYELEPGMTLNDGFEVVNNNKNASLLDENNYNYESPYGVYVNYTATYRILENGKTFGITGYNNVTYPNQGIYLEVYPESKKQETITWTSSNENIATVNDGMVWGVSPGDVTISAIDEHGETATYNVTVGIQATSVILNKTSLTLYVGDSEKLTATVSPSNATDKKVNFSVKYVDGIDWNNLPVSVSNDGTIIAIRPGTTTVEAYSSSGPTATCEVTVLEKQSSNVNATGISLDRTSATIEVGENIHLTPTVSPNNATNKTVNWSSSDETIAAVDSTGEVHGIKPGTVTITARTHNNKTATAKIKVTQFYDVTFYDSDGTTVLKDTEKYEYGTEASTIDKPMGLYRADDTIDGWYLDPELTELYDFTGTINSNLALYAKWAPIRVAITANPESVNYGEAYQNFENNIQKKITIKNTGNVTIALSLNNPTGDGPFGSMSFENNRIMEPNQEYEITLIANASSPFSGIPGTYNGNYRFTATDVDNIERKANVEVAGTIKINKLPQHIAYTTHVQNIGWQKYVRDGVMAGTSGRSLRLEGIKIKLENQEYPGNIEYKTHIQNIGWETSFKKNNEMSGTEGRSYRLEGIEIKLTGEMEDHYDVYYRVHAENFGWLGWARNGEDAGTAGYAYRLEGINIELVPKGEAFPEYGQKVAFKDKNAVQSITLNKTNLAIEAGEEETLTATISPSTASDKRITWTSDNESTATVEDGRIIAKAEGTATITATTTNGKKATCNVNVLPPIPGVKYTTHVQNIGWQKYVSNGAMAGTSGKSLRLEGIKIKLKNMPYEGDIEYRTHVQNIGWQSYVKNDQMSGTEGRSYRLEGINIRLTGEVADHYDIYYRVHAENFGWMGWARNDEMAGTAGYAYRLEGIEIQLVEKGQDFPDYGKVKAFREKK